MVRRTIVHVALIGAVLAVGGCGGSSDDSKTTASGSLRVQIAAPADGSSVSGDRVTVRGTVSPPDASVQIVGQNAQVGNGVFTGSVGLHSGSNTIDVVASAPGLSPVTSTITVRRGTSGSGKPSGSTQPPSTPSSSTGGVPFSSTTDCGGGTYAGPNTSCAFARNVRAEHERAEEAVIDVFSPTTGRTYRMYCTGGATNVCTGGNNASVWFGQRTYDTGNCGNGLSVGPSTSCSFAENVRAAYDRSGPGTVTAFSPVTGRTYTMYCTSGSPHVCTGGDGAAVYFP